MKHKISFPTAGKPKATAIAEAGLSKSTAHRYEELTGGRDEIAQKAGRAGARPEDKSQRRDTSSKRAADPFPASITSA